MTTDATMERLENQIAWYSACPLLVTLDPLAMSGSREATETSTYINGSKSRSSSSRLSFRCCRDWTCHPSRRWAYLSGS
jgi:hypothetical protein